MAKLVDVLAMLCRKGFGKTELVVLVRDDGKPATGDRVTVEEEYDREEYLVGTGSETQGDWGCESIEDGRLAIFSVQLSGAKPIRVYEEPGATGAMPATWAKS